jgi:rhodanese-related sulfurtransferase
MCHLDGSINIPLEELTSQLDTIEQLSQGQLAVYCLCRRGVASIKATSILQKSMKDGIVDIPFVYNIDGGLNEWVNTVDETFPWY